MSMTYESRILLSEFWAKNYLGGGVTTVELYLSSSLKGTGRSAMNTLRLETTENKRNWFVIRFKKDGRRVEMPIGKDDFVDPKTLDRLAFDLGWVDSKEWDDNQVSWRLDTTEERKPLSIYAFVVVASRTTVCNLFDATQDGTDYTWVPLNALFSDLPNGATFVGWKKAAKEAAKLQLEKVDKKYMFEKLFPPLYRDYIRTLLHLPIAVNGKIVKTVDFRNADPRAFRALLDHSEAFNPDDMFYAMVAFRVKIGVSKKGTLLAFPHLPARSASTNFIRLTRSDIPQGADVVPVETSTPRPHWHAQFPIVNTQDCVVLDMSTLSFWSSFHVAYYLRQNIFPRSSHSVLDDVIIAVFSWRMKWAYTFNKPLPLPFKSKRDTHSRVYISLLKPWY